MPVRLPISRVALPGDNEDLYSGSPARAMFREPIILPSVKSICIGCCMCLYPLRPKRVCCMKRCGLEGKCTGCCKCILKNFEDLKERMQHKIEEKHRQWLTQPMLFQD
nr:unnamed protein product [Hydra vulgaris]